LGMLQKIAQTMLKKTRKWNESNRTARGDPLAAHPSKESAAFFQARRTAQAGRERDEDSLYRVRPSLSRSRQQGQASAQGQSRSVCRHLSDIVAQPFSSPRIFSLTLATVRSTTKFCRACCACLLEATMTVETEGIGMHSMPY